MRKILFVSTLMFIFGGPALAADVNGTWKTKASDKGYLYVTIASCGDKVCGTIAEAFNTEGKKNPDYENIGKQMIWDMASEGDGAFDNGKIWAPDTDKTYSAKMKLSGDSLEVEGCAAAGLICRGQTWTRVN